MSLETLLTSHLSPLEVPEMLDSHLQDVRFLQLGVSGALRGRETRIVRDDALTFSPFDKGGFESD